MCHFDHQVYSENQTPKVSNFLDILLKKRTHRIISFQTHQLGAKTLLMQHDNKKCGFSYTNFWIFNTTHVHERKRAPNKCVDELFYK